MNRELWEKLEDPIYIQRGGIISLMGKTIIIMIVSATGLFHDYSMIILLINPLSKY